MKTVGIIGGIGPESIISYYRSIVAVYREKKQDGSYPSILINSIDLTKMLMLIGGGHLAQATEYLGYEVQRLARAGADFGLLAANTPHIIFDDIQRQSPIPLISIVEATCKEAGGLGLKKVGLFGIRFTMQGRFYPDVFSPSGIAIVRPAPENEAYIHDKYMNELVPGVFLPETRERVLSIARDLVRSERVDGVILGGTELPILFKGAGDAGVPFLDTTAIHVARITDEILS